MTKKTGELRPLRVRLSENEATLLCMATAHLAEAMFEALKQPGNLEATEQEYANLELVRKDMDALRDLHHRIMALGQKSVAYPGLDPNPERN